MKILIAIADLLMRTPCLAHKKSPRKIGGFGFCNMYRLFDQFFLLDRNGDLIENGEDKKAGGPDC